MTTNHNTKTVVSVKIEQRFSIGRAATTVVHKEAALTRLGLGLVPVVDSYCLLICIS